MKHTHRAVRWSQFSRTRTAARVLGGCVATFGALGAAHAQTAPEAAPAALPAALQPVVVVSAGAPALRGTVTATTNGTEVVIDGEGWHRGDHVEFVRERPASSGDPAEREAEVLGVGEVRYAAGDHARVTLPVDVRVPLGASAQRTSLPSASYPLAPPRLPGVLHLTTEARAFLPIGVEASFGLLGGVSALYRFEAPIAVRAMISPAGFVTARPASGTISAFGFVTLDTPYFEVGLGAGGMTTQRQSYDCSADPNCTYTSRSSGSFSLGQFVRIGSVDGLMLQEQTEVYIESGRFEFANISGTLQVPLASRWWLQARGGGGVAGYGYGEAVVRHLVTGNGDRGSLFLSGIVGGAGIQTASGMYAGPSVGAAFEWRL